MEEAKRQFEAGWAMMIAQQERDAVTPVNVLGTPNDEALDDHLAARLTKRYELTGLAGLHAWPDELRSYFLTRFFEREVGFGGPTGFLAFGGRDLAPFIADAYRRLGLTAAADAFTELWESPAMQALSDDVEAEVPDDELWRLIEKIGENDSARLAFVRAHPTLFSV